MREIVSPLSGIRSPFGQLTSPLAIYAVLGIKPDLVFDFDADKYFVNSRRSTFSDSITHSRAGNATMVDSDGTLKWAPHNLMSYSEDFTQWFGGSFVTADQVVAPDGNLTGDLVTYTDVDQLVRLFSISAAVVGATYTAKVWLKAGTSSTLSFALLFSGSGLGYKAEVLTLTNDWQLFSITQTVPPGTPDYVRLRLQSNESGTIYAWGAHAYRSDLGGMVNNPDRGDSYVPTTSSAVYLPRRGHHVYNGSAWVNEGLLHESEARTNLILNSETVEQKDVYVTNQEYTLSFKAGQQLRSEISETLGVTAVDVFVYDTSKDSDGGAWRTGALAQASSWYDETLNTSTRGSRQEFPAVAVIVAESNKVTIYDGDDPSLPMWMVFNGATSGWSISGFDTNSTVTSVSAMNGILVVGNNHASAQSRAGAQEVYFSSDTWIADRSNERQLFSLVVSARNTNPASAPVVANIGDPLVNGFVNDVAMTVLPDAPTDSATGLPVPTIAVATDGGVSVIKDDGTVVGSGSTLATNVCSFDATYGLWWSRNQSSYLLNYAAQTDYEAGGGFGDVVAASVAGYNFDMLTIGQGLAVTPDAIYAGGSSAVNRSVAGLEVILPNFTDFTKGMSALLTSTYNTGWMNGSIKGAFLSDTDDTDLVGSGELVTNGDFASDTDWTKGTGWTIGGGVASCDGTQTATTALSQAKVLSPGTYVIEFDITAQTLGSIYIYLGATIVPSVSGVGHYVYTFTVTSTTTTLYINGSSTFVGSVDNISIQRADADRSVNNNGLIVNGTVTRTAVATGADLVAYSGFSV